MSSSQYAIVNLETRRIVSTLTCGPAMLDLNTPEGCIAVEGVYDKESQIYDPETKTIVDYVPPSPGPDYAWVEKDELGRKVRRWRIRPEVWARRDQERVILERLAALDAKLVRTLDDLSENPEDTEAANIRADIRQEKDTLRAELKRLRGA